MMDILIKNIKKTSQKIKDFENKQRQLSDKEHRGTNVPNFEKKIIKLVAYDKQKNPIGILDMTIETENAHIENIQVSSSHRRQWIGQKLVIAAEQIASEKKCYKIWLDTIEDRWAVNFYKRMKYEITWKFEKHYFGKNAIIFTKFFK